MLSRACGLLAIVVMSQLLSLLPGQESVSFRRHVLSEDSQFSAATAFDVNRDGHMDVVCGAWWYEGPNWRRHRFREVQQIRGRYDDYSNLPLDVDRDGDLDIVSVNYRSRSLYWCRNPGVHSGADDFWTREVIDEPGPSETGRLVDIDGDGQLDVLPSGTSFAAWYELGPSPNGEVHWLRHDLPQQLAGHGLGAGDINGDGRMDVVCPQGWAEAPEDPRRGRWSWHPEFQLARDCGIPILCQDVDRDGDTDFVWARGHHVGLYWTEQLQTPRRPLGQVPGSADLGPVGERLVPSKWVTHAIDTSWACGHTLMLADVDGDGREDVVTGKRYQGHDGRDPGENDPLSIHWYQFDPARRTWRANCVSFGGRCGIDLDSTCVDLDGDGDVDILAPARCGLHWLENLGSSGEQTVADECHRAGETPAYQDHRDFSYYLDDQGRAALDSALAHGIRRQQILRQMEQVMGKFPSASSRVPLDIEIEQVEVAEKYVRMKLTFAAEPGDRVPAFLLVPKEMSEPARAMLCLHPTHFELGKAQICGLGGKPSRFYAHELAELGFVCLAPDYPGFGDYEFDFSAHRERYASGTMKAIWNHVRAVDVLQSLSFVDGDRIGVIGHSLGGHNALFAAAFDQRIRCVVTSCGFNAFEDYYGGDLRGWSSQRYMPRIATEFDCDPGQMPFDFPEVLAAIAPRPAFVNAPVHDANFAVEGVIKCEQSVRPLYELLGASESLSFVYPDAEHDFPQPVRKQTYAWLKAALD